MVHIVAHLCLFFFINADRLGNQGAAGVQEDNTVSFQEMKTLIMQGLQLNSKADRGLPSADPEGSR